MIDVVELVKQGKCRYEWAEVCSSYNKYKLYIKVFRDAMKFNNIPALTWNFIPIVNNKEIYNGVRLPASAHQLQEIADLLGCMLMTPKVIDLIWLQSKLKFNAVTNVRGQIVAISNINKYHELLEKQITKLGGDDGTKLITCVGKYWCLMNALWDNEKEGDYTACNYGWFSLYASRFGITPGTRCWQRPGFWHNKLHRDPSQVIRLMSRQARLIDPTGKEELVDLYDIAANKELAPLLHHEGVLTYLRQQGVPFRKPLMLSKPKPEPEPEPKPEPEPEPESELELELDEGNTTGSEAKLEENDGVENKSKKSTKDTFWQIIWSFILMFLSIFKKK